MHEKKGGPGRYTFSKVGKHKHREGSNYFCLGVTTGNFYKRGDIAAGFWWVVRITPGREVGEMASERREAA